MKSGGQQTGFVSLCREILTRFIEDRFPTSVEGLVSDGGALWLVFTVHRAVCVSQCCMDQRMDGSMDLPYSHVLKLIILL